MKRKIAVVTGSRAEYGLLYRLLKEIDNDAELELQLVATGTHLSPEYGLGWHEIEADGFLINEKLEILLCSDSTVGMTKSLGLAVIGFAEIWQRLQPDLLVLLGDRYEILAAAQAGLLAHIPIAHIAGGESSQGAVDEAIRHAVSKMACWHFVASKSYRKRVVQLGEDPRRVFDFGSTGLDAINRMHLLSRPELEAALDFSLGQCCFLLTWHPETLEAKAAASHTGELLAALDEFPEAKIIMTGSNADMGGRIINADLQAYAQERKERVRFVMSLGQLRYLSALKHCDLVVGNSSSAIIEAPYLKTAAVNIGSRQEGRLKAASIIDCRPERQEIAAAISRGLSPAFQAKLRDLQSLYGAGDASRRIKETLKTVKLDDVLQKKFYDIDFTVE